MALDSSNDPTKKLEAMLRSQTEAREALQESESIRSDQPIGSNDLRIERELAGVLAEDEDDDPRNLYSQYLSLV